MPPPNGNLLLRIEELKRKIILSLLEDMIHPSVVSICDFSFLFCLCLSVALPQFPWFPWFHYGLPRVSSFTPHLSTRSVQYTSPKRRSLAQCGCSLSLWHSLPQKGYGTVRVPWKDRTVQQLNGHMVWCGCHEFLIQRSFNFLFLTHLC